MTDFEIYGLLISFLILFLCFRYLQTLFLALQTIHEFPRQFFRQPLCLRKSLGILPCLNFIPELLWREPLNEHQVLSLRTSRILLFTTKGNTRFRRSLILKRESWHPETWKCSRSTAVTFRMLFTNSFIYLDFLPFERTAPSFNGLLCSFQRSLRIFLPLRWISDSRSGHCSGMKVPAALRILDIAQLYFWKSVCPTAI